MRGTRVSPVVSCVILDPANSIINIHHIVLGYLNQTPQPQYLAKTIAARFRHRTGSRADVTVAEPQLRLNSIFKLDHTKNLSSTSIYSTSTGQEHPAQQLIDLRIHKLMGCRV